jgi:hypothetical protein
MARTAETPGVAGYRGETSHVIDPPLKGASHCRHSTLPLPNSIHPAMVCLGLSLCVEHGTASTTLEYAHGISHFRLWT